MNKSELIKLCTKQKDSISVHPWDKYPASEYAVIKHKSNQKWFALVFELEGELCVNLKCNPFDAVMLRDMNEFIRPAWHMNKKHWNTIYIEKCPIKMLENLIKESYKLTA